MIRLVRGMAAGVLATAVLVVVVLAIALALAGCGSDDGGDQQQPQYQGVCVDPNTQVRIDDSNCRGAAGAGGGAGNGDSGMNGVMEYLLLSQLLDSRGSNSVYVVPVGQRVEHAVRDVPRGSSVHREAAPARGGYATFNHGGRAASWQATPPPKWVEPAAPGSRPDPKATTSASKKPSLFSRLKGSSSSSKSGSGSRRSSSRRGRR